jgi:hypothetical protein
VPDYYVHVKFQNRIINMLDTSLDTDASILEMRIFLSNLLGFPLGIFRLRYLNPETNKTIDLYDCWSLKYYGLNKKCTFILETWQGWESFLTYCIKGFTKQCIKAMSFDELIRQYQMKVALYISAHYGNFELASTLIIVHGVRADRPGKLFIFL